MHKLELGALVHAEGTAQLPGHPHCTHYQEGQDPTNGWFNLWLPSDPGVLPRVPACACHHHCSPGKGAVPFGSPGRWWKALPPTSLLAPSLATCLEAKLGEIPSWNFSFRSWDEIVPTGKQLGI